MSTAASAAARRVALNRDALTSAAPLAALQVRCREDEIFFSRVRCGPFDDPREFNLHFQRPFFVGILNFYFSSAILASARESHEIIQCIHVNEESLLVVI